MKSSLDISGRQVAAARVLTGVSRAELAKACGLPVEEMRRIETNGSALLAAGDTERLLRAFDKFGVVPVAEGDGLGAGVRLKFTRADARQIGRLEGEGGNVGEDDVP